MLRATVIAVLLANALFLAWTMDWLSHFAPAPVHGEREPARLKAQLRPETISVLTPKAASAAVQAARAASMAAGEGEACVQLGPYADSDLASIENKLAAAGLPRDAWERRDSTGEVNRVMLRFEKATPALREHLRALVAGVENCVGR
jgi:hypothetical protein